MLFAFNHQSNELAHEVILEQARGLSPHLDRLFKIHGDDLALILKKEFEAIIKNANEVLTSSVTATKDDTILMAAIRHYRGRINHLVAVTDFLDLADIEQHMKWLTDAAEFAMATLTDHLAGEDAQSWFILALGKMGAGELNYSSDIDLIIITLIDHDDYEKAQKLIRITRRLVSVMSTPTKDGIGWRIDLRLRPDPGATPIAIHHDAAMSYYESLARTWERAAFIRARPVAGNKKAGQDFLDDLKPFIWRRYLDFTVLEDLKVMLRREARADDLIGYNIKNGFGGIRSIEFFVHAQQLIAGGREAELRISRTPHALDALARNKWISIEAAVRLKDAYKVWRRVEHRLQMIGDAQTHSLPRSDEMMAEFARFCGAESFGAFKEEIITLGNQVNNDTAPLLRQLERQSTPSDNAQEDDFSISQDNAEGNHNVLRDLGYEHPETIVLTTQGWLAGRIPATRSSRSRDLFAAMLPRLLRQLAETGNPDISFAAFARLVENLPAGLQLFSLMDSHDDIAEMIIGIVTSAPKLADIISSHPVLADSLLYRSFWRPEDNWHEREKELQKALSDQDDYEERLLVLRRMCRDWQFRVSAQLLQEQITPSRAGEDFSHIADIIIRGGMKIAHDNLKRRFGDIEDSGITILALGRLGAQEMTLLSDLDLIFIFDGESEAVSAGQVKIKPLYINQYYARFGQELINVLSAPTAEGRCYDIDMRLRPSGNKGPVAVHLDTFISYQDNEAWTWEHMALIKSRVVGHCGARDSGPVLEERIPSLIKKIRQEDDVIHDVAMMRERLKSSQKNGSALNIRSSDGGIMDLDFLVQMIQLFPQASALPVQRRASDAGKAFAEAGLVNTADTEAIIEAAQTYLNVIQLMRLLDMAPSDKIKPEEQLPNLLKKSFNINTFGEFSKRLEEIAEPISAMMKNFVSKVEKRE